MILICDRTESARAAGIREMLYRAGCPAAVLALSDYREIMPARLIVTFTDALDALRKTPLDDLHAIALGEGFVNSALNAQSLRNEDELPKVIRRELLIRSGIGSDAVTPFGVFAHPSVFLAKDFFEIRGFRVEPTKAEYMIFKYLMSDYGRGRYLPPEVILKFCFPSNKLRDESSAISVHISNLNKKARNACGDGIIETMRYSGYRASVPL